MSYQCPKGHMSSDPDYCSECGAKIGNTSATNKSTGSFPQSSNNQEICPDCGTPRISNDRFCEVCRHDFVEGKTGTAEKVVEAKQPAASPKFAQTECNINSSAVEAEQRAKITNLASSNVNPDKTISTESRVVLNTVVKKDIVIAEKFNIVISVDKNRLAQNLAESSITPDSTDRVFPLDLDENLVGRRSIGKGIYPEIEINDPGVSRRQLKFIKRQDGVFEVLELGSANGTEYNGVQLEAGVNTVIKVGDEFSIGLWTTLKVVAR